MGWRGLGFSGMGNPVFFGHAYGNTALGITAACLAGEFVYNPSRKDMAQAVGRDTPAGRS